MPTYDYQCRSCGAITEVIHAMTADGPTVCDRCNGELRRVLYPAGIIFKGSGFYRTDSRASGSSTVSGSKGGAPSSSTTASGDGGAKGSGDGSPKASGSNATDSGSSGSRSGSESAA